MLRRLNKLLCVSLALMLATAALCPAMAMSVSVKVNSSSAKVYKSPSTSSANVSVKKGLELTVTAVSGSWARVKKSGNTGYMLLKYLDAKTRKKAYVNQKTYVYKSASSSSSKMQVSANTVVYVVGRDGDYYRIQNSSGSRTGYIKPKYLSSSSVSGGSGSWKDKVVKLDWYKGGSDVLKLDDCLAALDNFVAERVKD